MRIFRNKDFSKISLKSFTNTTSIAGFLFLAVLIYICFEVYVPINPMSHETIIYTVQKGWGDEDIAKDLQKLGIIRSSGFFRFYVVMSFQHSRLQAGKYNLSPRMSAYKIVKKMSEGDVIKIKAVIPEGWDTKDIAEYMQEKEICSKDEFLKAVKQDFSQYYDFLKSNPKDVGVEGFLYPDTYQIAEGESCEDVIHLMLDNFDKKVVQGMAEQITGQKKSLFDVITMASILEKEAATFEDKKIVAGILWKRIDAGMPMQVDCTINYITGKNAPGAAIKDTKIDSPYNTYKYLGLPKGPIASPGKESILAAITPKKSSYWFYLGFNGKTIFTATLAEHNEARSIYLR